MDFIMILACHRNKGTFAVLQLHGSICCLVFEWVSLYSSLQVAKCYTPAGLIVMQNFAVSECIYIRVLALTKSAGLNQMSWSFLFLHCDSCPEGGVGVATLNSFLIKCKWKMHSRRSPNTVKLLKGIQSWQN